MLILGAVSNREIDGYAFKTGLLADWTQSQLNLYRAGRPVDEATIQATLALISQAERGGRKAPSKGKVNLVPIPKEERRAYGYFHRAWIHLGICPVTKTLVRQKAGRYRALLRGLLSRKTDPRSEELKELQNVFRHISGSTLSEAKGKRWGCN